MQEKTVAAVSTPRGRGGVAMVRVSGEKAFQIARRVFKPSSGREITDYPPNTAVRGGFYDKDSLFDDGMAVLYKSPKSFTGEDTAELFCHGGLLVTRKLLSAVISAGADWASPGEFTKRAFINGKLSLTEAEAVAGIIDAVSEKHLEVSLTQLGGALSRKITAIYEKLKFLAASVYAYIDYPDEDMTDVTCEEMKQTLRGISEELHALCQSRKYGKAISEGVKTVIAGRPNTGKSSLLNLLIGEERVIVTDIEGTTRDIVTEKITLGDVVLDLSDTAGIRDGSGVNMIEKIGIENAKAALKEAEIILFVIEKTLSDYDREIINIIKEAGSEDKTIALYNKSDLGGASPGGVFKNEIVFSAKTGEGKGLLVRAISGLCGKSEARDVGGIIVSARQYGALEKANECVKNAIGALDIFTQDIAGMDIEEALGFLGEADGREVSEDVVNGIFSNFCVGK